jgi:hypothetical protein
MSWRGGIRTVSLVREVQGDQGTFGRLVIDYNLILKTGELPWRDINNDNLSDSMLSRIPPGWYRCQFTISQKFPQGTFQIIDVENNHRTGVRIHKGNWCGDKTLGYYSDVEGCILLGTIVEQRPCTKNSNKIQWGVFNSVMAYNLFMQEMGNSPFDLEVTEEFA